jgi:outer membrane receptor protein involved in Fe transport
VSVQDRQADTAQTDPTSATSNQGSGGVDEIVVTAQKREQSLQDVPIVVTVVSQQALQDAGVRDIKDLTILTPGVTVTSTASEASTTARVRGVGTVGDNLDWSPRSAWWWMAFTARATASASTTSDRSSASRC